MGTGWKFVRFDFVKVSDKFGLAARKKATIMSIYIVTDIHVETVLEILFWRQVLFSFLSAVPSRYLSFLFVDPDCYNPIQHLEIVFVVFC